MKTIVEDLKLLLNLEIQIIEHRKTPRVYYRNTHNIVVNTGKQFLAENITPATLGAGGAFTRTQNTVVRYMGFGIGGFRQSSPDANAAPYSNIYPAGYDYAPAGTHNTQTDTDVTVGIIQRPVKVTTGPDLWMRELSTPGTFPLATSTKFIATFGPTDINFGAFTSVPISEIGLYKSSADPTLPNGGAGAYPGPGGHMIAYDAFDPFHKSGMFSVQVLWEWRF